MADIAMRVWVDDSHVEEACQTAQVFQEDAQRMQGFASGNPASSTRVNTALRQANVVAVGLVQALAKHNSVLEGCTHETDVNTMATAIGEALAQYVSSETGSSFEDLNNKVNRIDGGKLGANTNIGEDGVPVYVKAGQITPVPVVDKAANVTTNINGKAITSIFETNGTTVKNATNAANVTTNINGHAISSIFESNGTTVKNATKAAQDGSGNNIVNTYATKASLSSESSTRQTNDNALGGRIDDIISGDTPVDQANNATTASNYASSGTIKSEFDSINTRLTSLGFKSGSVQLGANVVAAENWLQKIGTMVIGRLLFQYTADSSSTLQIGTIPADFRPAKSGTYQLNCGNYLNDPNQYIEPWNYGSSITNFDAYRCADVMLDASTGIITCNPAMLHWQTNYCPWLCVFFAYDINRMTCMGSAYSKVKTAEYTLTKNAGTATTDFDITLSDTTRATYVVCRFLIDDGFTTESNNIAYTIAGINAPATAVGSIGGMSSTGPPYNLVRLQMTAIKTSTGIRVTLRRQKLSTEGSTSGEYVDTLEFGGSAQIEMYQLQ